MWKKGVLIAVHVTASRLYCKEAAQMFQNPGMYVIILNNL
jgi:hypothetical protein